jgi:hypothetical protein
MVSLERTCKLAYLQELWRREDCTEYWWGRVAMRARYDPHKGCVDRGPFFIRIPLGRLRG